MGSGKILLILVGLLIMTYTAFGAVIHGTVYDLSLKKINAKIEINTTPKQTVIAQNGSYSFIVDNGVYNLRASAPLKNDFSLVEENITVLSNGRYVLDMILFPQLEDPDEPNLEVNGLVEEKNLWIYGILILSVLALGAFFAYTKMKPKYSAKIPKPHDVGPNNNELENMIELIKKEGGRTTQKEIRKQIPLSEAKISLMVAELEHKGVIEKIKRGRGNIIILKK